MGFYFRKSYSLGPFRVNLSKSGIGVSFGVKGARISHGPRGTFFSASNGPIYYRKKIKTTHKPEIYNQPSMNKNMPKNSIYVSKPQKNSSKTSKESYSSPSNDKKNNYYCNLERAARTIRNARIGRFLGLSSVVIFIFLTPVFGSLYPLITAIILFILWIVFINVYICQIDMEVSESSRQTWNALADALELFASCKGKWIYKSENKYKFNQSVLGSTVFMSRGKRRESVISGSGFRIKEKDYIVISSGLLTVYILPQFVLYINGHRVFIKPYESIYISCNSDIVTLNSTNLPSDIDIKDYVYEHTTVKGTPDMRYKSNNAYPIVELSILHIADESDFCLEIAASSNRYVGMISNACNSFINEVYDKDKGTLKQQDKRPIIAESTDHNAYSDENMPEPFDELSHSIQVPEPESIINTPSEVIHAENKTKQIDTKPTNQLMSEILRNTVQNDI